MNSGRFSQNSLSLATSCAFLPNCLVNVFQSGNSSPAVLIRRRMSATVGSRPVSSASRANFSNNAASPWALVILLGSYPASLIASLHRAQCLPFHSDSAMPVSVANFRHPNGVPPLMAVVLLISAMISAFVISARYLIQRSARVQNHNSWASWLASDDTRIFLTFRQEDSGIARKAHCAPHGADERVRERIRAPGVVEPPIRIEAMFIGGVGKEPSLTVGLLMSNNARRRCEKIVVKPGRARA